MGPEIRWHWSCEQRGAAQESRWAEKGGRQDPGTCDMKGQEEGDRKDGERRGEILTLGSWKPIKSRAPGSSRSLPGLESARVQNKWWGKYLGRKHIMDICGLEQFLGPLLCINYSFIQPTFTGLIPLCVSLKVTHVSNFCCRVVLERSWLPPVLSLFSQPSLISCFQEIPILPQLARCRFCCWKPNGWLAHLVHVSSREWLPHPSRGWPFDLTGQSKQPMLCQNEWSSLSSSESQSAMFLRLSQSRPYLSTGVADVMGEHWEIRGEKWRQIFYSNIWVPGASSSKPLALPFAGQITSPFGLCQFELGFYNQKDLFNTKHQRSKVSDNLHVSSWTNGFIDRCYK